MCLPFPAHTGNWIQEARAGLGRFGEAARSDGPNFHSTYVMYFRGSRSLNCENRTISSVLERTKGCLVGSGLGPEPERKLRSQGTRNFPGSLAGGLQVGGGIRPHGGGVKAWGTGRGAPEPPTAGALPHAAQVSGREAGPTARRSRLSGVLLQRGDGRGHPQDICSVL